MIDFSALTQYAVLEIWIVKANDYVWLFPTSAYVSEKARGWSFPLADQKDWGI